MVTIISVFKLEGLTKTFIEDLVVDQSQRRKGIGEALMKRVVEEVKKMGAHKLMLTSRSERIAANKLYDKLGFRLYKTNNYIYEF